MAALLELGEELPRAFKRLDFVDQLGVELSLGGSDVVALPLLDLVASDRAHELVAAHPYVAVKPPDREDDAVATKGPVPGQSVVVVGVDERSVNVENGGRRHRPNLPA